MFFPLYLEISHIMFNDCWMMRFVNFIPFFFILVTVPFFVSCLEEEKSVTLGTSVVDKKLSMTTYKCDQTKVEVYLVSYDAVEGELLAKALDGQGKEIGRTKQMLNLGKDDAKLITFTFDASVKIDQVSRYILDFRKR